MSKIIKLDEAKKSSEQIGKAGRGQMITQVQKRPPNSNPSNSNEKAPLSRRQRRMRERGSRR